MILSGRSVMVEKMNPNPKIHYGLSYPALTFHISLIICIRSSPGPKYAGYRCSCRNPALA